MEKSQQIRYFLFSQYFSDGVRITLEIIIPALVFAYLGDLETGLAMSLGALCVSISDGPGPVVHKKNGMFFCNLFVFISALLTGFLNHNPLTLGILILSASFVFTMFSVFGNRANAIGFAALLIMILQMTKVIPFHDVVKESVLILAGGVWYMLVALLLFRITPYRPAQRTVGDCVRETANYLLIKAEMFNVDSDLKEQYQKMLDQQVVVNEKQNETRELLFKNRALLKESTLTGRMLVLTFVDIVDLFEQIMASGYDYEELRKDFARTGVLNEVYLILKEFVAELNHIGEAIQANGPYRKQSEVEEEMKSLKERIEILSLKRNMMAPEKVFSNLLNLKNKIDHLSEYFNEDVVRKKKLRSRGEYRRFVSHQTISWKVFENNLAFDSSIFRHSLRVMITCGVGFILSKLFLHGNHSYWILMTIIIILKPAFSLTKKKNADRLLGTIGGGILGLLLLFFIHDKVILLCLLIFFMLGTYTFKTLNYIVMVVFLTPYVLILFHFLGLGALNVASERLMDTAIGSVLAALGSYFLFPIWESSQLQNYMANVLKANIHFLKKLRDLYSGKETMSLDYKVVRKELFVSTANLSAALHRMQSEPKNKQMHKNEIYEFVVLNNLLSSNVASLSSEMMELPTTILKEFIKPLESSIDKLQNSLDKLNENNNPSEDYEIKRAAVDKKYGDEKYAHLEFIRKLIFDIDKITNIIVDKKELEPSK
ncbi:MAG: FUSC family membrane protein [Ginsengibacter sp.]